jgi:hypothetical protein
MRRKSVQVRRGRIGEAAARTRSAAWAEANASPPTGLFKPHPREVTLSRMPSSVCLKKLLLTLCIYARWKAFSGECDDDGRPVPPRTTRQLGPCDSRFRDKAARRRSPLPSPPWPLPYSSPLSHTDATLPPTLHSAPTPCSLPPWTSSSRSSPRAARSPARPAAERADSGAPSESSRSATHADGLTPCPSLSISRRLEQATVS